MRMLDDGGGDIPFGVAEIDDFFCVIHILAHHHMLVVVAVQCDECGAVIRRKRIGGKKRFQLQFFDVRRSEILVLNTVIFFTHVIFKRFFSANLFAVYVYDAVAHKLGKLVKGIGVHQIYVLRKHYDHFANAIVENCPFAREGMGKVLFLHPEIRKTVFGYLTFYGRSIAVLGYSKNNATVSYTLLRL